MLINLILLLADLEAGNLYLCRFWTSSERTVCNESLPIRSFRGGFVTSRPLLCL